VNVRPKAGLRLVAVLASAGVVLAAGGWAGAAPRPLPGVPPGRPSAVADAIGAPAIRSASVDPQTWCCANGTMPGLTVSGQATVRGRGTSARDAAIAQAVADATDQAHAAATAAGITLGRIVSMDVSTSPSVYPVFEGAAGSSGEGVEGSSGAGRATGVQTTPFCPAGVACPASTPCSCPPLRVAAPQQYASVTIAWAIG